MKACFYLKMSDFQTPVAPTWVQGMDRLCWGCSLLLMNCGPSGKPLCSHVKLFRSPQARWEWQSRVPFLLFDEASLHILDQEHKQSAETEEVPYMSDEMFLPLQMLRSDERWTEVVDYVTSYQPSVVQSCLGLSYQVFQPLLSFSIRWPNLVTRWFSQWFYAQWQWSHLFFGLVLFILWLIWWNTSLIKGQWSSAPPRRGLNTWSFRSD